MATESHQEYRHRAEECERLATIATNTEVRGTLRYLAKRWTDFAIDAEFKLKHSRAFAWPQYPEPL